jgi:hypothetical protein
MSDLQLIRLKGIGRKRFRLLVDARLGVSAVCILREATGGA